MVPNLENINGRSSVQFDVIRVGVCIKLGAPVAPMANRNSSGAVATGNASERGVSSDVE